MTQGPFSFLLICMQWDILDDGEEKKKKERKFLQCGNALTKLTDSSRQKLTIAAVTF